MPDKYFDFVVMVLIMFVGPLLWGTAYKERITYEAIREITEGFTQLLADHGELTESLLMSAQNKLRLQGEGYRFEITDEACDEEGVLIRQRILEPKKLAYKSIIKVSVVWEDEHREQRLVYQAVERVMGVSTG